MAFCFVDLTGFTRFTEEEGDEEALDLVERFIETVEATLPRRRDDRQDDRRRGDDRLARSREMLTEWAVGFLTLFDGAAAAAGRRSTSAAPSTATATTSAATSTSPTGSSPGRWPARCS